MTPRRLTHIGLCAAAILCSAASLYMLGELGATRWTMAFNVVSIVLILAAIRMRPARAP
jgi:hypothetical protein